MKYTPILLVFVLYIVTIFSALIDTPICLTPPFTDFNKNHPCMCSTDLVLSDSENPYTMNLPLYYHPCGFINITFEGLIPYEGIFIESTLSNNLLAPSFREPPADSNFKLGPCAFNASITQTSYEPKFLNDSFLLWDAPRSPGYGNITFHVLYLQWHKSNRCVWRLTTKTVFEGASQCRSPCGSFAVSSINPVIAYTDQVNITNEHKSDQPSELTSIAYSKILPEIQNSGAEKHHVKNFILQWLFDQ